MKDEIINQYDHTWKMFHIMVNDFDQESWTKTGCAYITPARISYHILGGVNYYIENQKTVKLISGKNNDWNWKNARIEDLPAQDDIINMIRFYKRNTESWINNSDLEAINTKFTWTGKNKLSVILFLLRHMEYHIGELNLLLHISNDDNVNDNWIKAFDNIGV